MNHMEEICIRNKQIGFVKKYILNVHLFLDKLYEV